MNTTLTFTVEVKFADKITDDLLIMEVAQNIVNAVENETNAMGIAPEDSETYTTEVSVKPQFLDETVTRKFI